MFSLDTIGRRFVAPFVLVSIAMLADGTLHNASAETYPTRAIRLVVSQPPGGTMDMVSRLIAQHLQESLGQSVIVENRPGANGNIAAKAVAQSKPDGYTLIMGTGATHTINPYLYADVGYDPVNDFHPISNLVTAPNIISVQADFPAKTVPELIALAKQSPGSINYASAGYGGTGQLTMELLKATAAIDLTHVPHRGIASAVQETIAGRTQVTAFPPAALIPQYQAGKLRPLAVSSTQRLALLPDVPTVAEEGFPDFEGVAWFGILAPSGVPDSVSQTLISTLERIMDNVELQNKFASLGMQTAYIPGANFKAYLAKDAERWKHVIKVSGARVE